MDKKTYILEASKFYALALSAALEGSGESVTRQIVSQRYALRNFEDTSFLLNDDNLWELGVLFLVDKNLIHVSKAAFGPAVYFRGEEYEKVWDAMKVWEQPFSQYHLTGSSREWLMSALAEIQDVGRSLRMTDEDYVDDADDWSPVEVDSESPVAKELIERLDSAADAIRSDNGYAATFPEERAVVLDGITRASESVKSGRTTAGVLKEAFTKITLALNRFQGAIIEASLTGAKQALIDFVKTQGGEILRQLRTWIIG